MTALLTLFAPVIAELWTAVIYPEILKLEPKLPAASQPFATAIAAALNTFVGQEIAKL